MSRWLGVRVVLRCLKKADRVRNANCTLGRHPGGSRGEAYSVLVSRSAFTSTNAAVTWNLTST